MEMNCKIWSKLPEEVVILVLAHIPTLMIGKFRAVCKRWRSLLSPSHFFQKMSRTVDPSCSPAFLIGRLHPSNWIHSPNNNLYVLRSQSSPSSSSHICRLSLEILAGESINVVGASNSVLCCCKEGDPTSFYIHNPITKRSKTLPPPTLLRRWDFIGFAFDTSRRVSILVIGRTNVVIGQKTHKILVEIYSSESNAWTELQMNTEPENSISPLGEGIFSRGRFYWINTSSYLELNRRRVDVTSLDVKEKRWDVIERPPERPDGSRYCENSYYWKLTGYDGKIVLVYNKDLCLWKLDEDGTKEGNTSSFRWSELQQFPISSLRGDGENGFNSKICAQVVVNSSGWALVHLPGDKIVVFNDKGRMMQSIETRVFPRAYPTSIRAFQINNVWWP